ncbi:hypothetical protein ACE6H2_025191 [Prunus campanulata]
MIKPVNEVSIELSKLDEEGESSKLKEDGGHRSTSSAAAKRSKLEDKVVSNEYQINQQPQKFLPKWEIIFTVASAFAVFVDPLSCYVPVIIEDSTCFSLDHTLMWTFFALRSAGDLFYGMDILVFIKRRRGNVNAKPPASWAKHFGGPYSKIWKELKGKISLRFLGILPRICAALPILQAIILTGQYTTYFGNIYSKLFYLIPIQYTLRAYNLYLWLDRRANIETAVKRFLKSALDFLPFILAAHLFGALWYYFAVDRKIIYWEEHVCKFNKTMCGRGSGMLDRLFYCDSSSIPRVPPWNISLLRESCAVQLSANVTTLHFDFGIYIYALQSDMTSSKDLPLKILQCFWWGLRNLSSFGSNLSTSFFKEEIILSIIISISGLVLFLVYLNSRVQVSKYQHQLQQKIEMMYPEDMTKQMRNMWHLGLASLKKVPLLESTDEKVLKAICQYLKPVTYGEDVYIIREGEPLRKMFFITRGTALTYTTIKGGTNVCKCLEKSDFYGEELLNWAFKSCIFSELPIATTTLMSQTKVEAFSIRANHLKSIVAQFWLDFRRGLSHSQLEHFAASYIQAFWRRRCAKAKGPTGCDKLTLN